MKRVLSLVLALALLVGAIAVLASCGDTGDSNTTADPMKGITTGATEGTTTKNYDNLEPGQIDPYEKLTGYEDVNFGGYTFTFAAHINADDGWADYEVYAEEDDGGILSAAIILRNDIMYENYDCFIEVEDINEGTLTNDFATGQNNIDIANCKYNVQTKGNGQYYNFYDLNIDLTKPWWDQGFINDVTVDGQLYGILGAFSLTSFDATWALFFNKSVHESNPEISDIDFYELVYNNEWTLDKFFEIIKKAGSDDGDLVMTTGTEDIFGFVSSSFGIRGLYFGAGQGYSVKTTDNAGESKFTNAFGDSAVQATQKIIEIYNHEYVTTAAYTTVYSQISGGLTLFAPETLNKVAMFAGATGGQATVQVGILPHPKLSTDQANYKHNIDNHMIYAVVPKTCADIERIAQFLTLYAFHSYNTVYSEYLKLYKYTYTTDSDAATMVDTILSSRSFDLAYQFNWASVDNEYLTAVQEGRNVIAELKGSLGGAIEEAAVNYKEYLAEHNK